MKIDYKLLQKLVYKFIGLSLCLIKRTFSFTQLLHNNSGFGEYISGLLADSRLHHL